MGSCYAITSGKGGTGKSTVCVGLGLTLAKEGKKTLLVDMDEGLRCLDLMLGVESRLTFDLSDVLSGKSIEDATYSALDVPNLFLIPAPDTIGKINPEDFKIFAEQILKEYDVVIFDFPAGIDFELYKYLPQNVIVLAVCNADPVSVRDAASVCNHIPIARDKIKLIINKYVYKTLLKGLFTNIDNIIDESGFKLIGVIPQSEDLAFFAIKHRLKRRGRAAKAFSRISKRLSGEYKALPKPKKI